MMATTNRKPKTMNDWWNDPPETPEPPECCGDIMDVDDEGNCRCPKCGKVIPYEADDTPQPCPHCGSLEGTWFSRIEPMGHICEGCGKDVDLLPDTQ